MHKWSQDQLEAFLVGTLEDEKSKSQMRRELDDSNSQVSKYVAEAERDITTMLGCLGQGSANEDSQQ